MDMIKQFDVIVIGGGATGLGVAVEAQSRGYKTLLVEAYDFGKGASSKSTKLVHGGIRYLANLDFSLVKEGLNERHYFLANAPHLAHPQSYLIPLYSLWNKLKYSVGVRLYDFLAGGRNIGDSKFLSRSETISIAPNIVADKLIGSVIYYDGQFDDTRMLISLLRTFQDLGGTAYNYCKVLGFIKRTLGTDSTVENNEDDNQVIGIKTIEQEFYGKVIINATGTLTDTILDLDEPKIKHHNVTASQGTHLVLDKHFFSCEAALVIPETSDGRILFVLPWLDNKIVVGTTDIMVQTAEIEPTATSNEIDFILTTLNQYTTKKVTKDDIRSIFSGQRPLVSPNNTREKTGKISRKHEILFSKSGIISIVGGKWTIYRLMGEDTINTIVQRGLLPIMPNNTKSITQNMPLHGVLSTDTTNNIADCHQKNQYPLSVYGCDANIILAIQHTTGDFSKLHDRLPYYSAEVIYHVRYEMAKTVEDVLARRTHAIILDAKAAIESAALVAALMAHSLNKPKEWELEQINAFKKFAANYCIH
jgi:glycerol-3-phosphate dehydrogenase